ncbi:hypothetical protein [Salinigranum halophilum]|jgi:small-conductance mechanosensitive channel|uniref:hypothetical protein n=1 Tax=Salinigranum halophilum TaxID=2565931 RepID=UPI00115C8DBD|nr:hypothetical protein [Salinigranum halophilum]
MPSTDVVTRIRERLWTQRNLTVVVAISLGLALTHGFSVVFGPDGSFLLLLAVGVVVPTLYDEYWPRYDRTWKAVGWIGVAAGVVAAAFAGLYWVGTEGLALAELPASAGAFVLITVGGIVTLGRWSHR